MNEIKNVSVFIRTKRERLGFSRFDFARLLDLGEKGEERLAGWEEGKPVLPSKLKVIKKMPDGIPFHKSEHKFKFIDLFAGIGGMRLGFQGHGGECVFSSEWDRHAQKTYAINFGEIPHGDITQIQASEIPDHDILLAGFPCQAFSQAGLKKGFLDTRGTMFFEIQRILAEKRPKAFLLENVKQLKGHDKGRTLETILEVLEGEFDGEIPADIPLMEETRHALADKLNYQVDFKVLNARNFGVPQNRQRIYIVGFDRNFFNSSFRFPEGTSPTVVLGDILEDSRSVDPKFTITEKMWDGHQRRRIEHKEKGNGFGYSLFNAKDEYSNTISARYWKDGSEVLIDQKEIGKRPRTLTPTECARLQGFPEDFIIDFVSKRYIYQQFGNSVSVPVIKALAEEMLDTMGYQVRSKNQHDQKNFAFGHV